MTLTSQQKRSVRHKRIRSRVHGTAECPRLAVYRSNRFIYAQLINDDASVTIAQAHDTEAKKGTKIDHAKSVGSEIAKKAQSAGITKCVFDRGGFLYTGRISALADAARESGLIF